MSKSVPYLRVFYAVAFAYAAVCFIVAQPTLDAYEICIMPPCVIGLVLLAWKAGLLWPREVVNGGVRSVRLQQVFVDHLRVVLHHFEACMA